MPTIRSGIDRTDAGSVTQFPQNAAQGRRPRWPGRSCSFFPWRNARWCRNPPLCFERFLPPNRTAHAVPLVERLHRCHPTAAVFRKATGMDVVATREGFAVLYR
jgi:hypothetical protein